MSRLTKITKKNEIRNAGSIPGIGGYKRYFPPSLSQAMIVMVPDIIPARAPSLVVFRHHRDRRITGPREAARPPHANATRR